MNIKQLDFTIFCVNIVAQTLNLDARDIYHRMQKADIIMGYIVPSFDVLHTFSSQYLADDLIAFMKRKGVLPS